MSGAFRPDVASWPPARSLFDDGAEAVRSPRRLGLIFAVAAIAGPALMTVGSVAKFSVEPSQRAPDKTSAIDANQPGLTASLVPKSLPVRKVVTTPVRVARPSAPQTVASEAALLEDRNTLEQHNPRWARGDNAVAFVPIIQPHTYARESGMAATVAVARYEAKTSPAAEAARQRCGTTAGPQSGDAHRTGKSGRQHAHAPAERSQRADDRAESRQCPTGRLQALVRDRLQGAARLRVPGFRRRPSTG